MPNGIPDFVQEWADENELEPYTLQWEHHPDEWEEIYDKLSYEQKYSNVHEMVLKHIPTGRYVRLEYEHLPYGITEYGMEDFDHEIVEVFPVRVTDTQYMTTEEMKACRILADDEPEWSEAFGLTRTED